MMAVEYNSQAGNEGLEWRFPSKTQGGRLFDFIVQFDMMGFGEDFSTSLLSPDRIWDLGKRKP